MEDGAYIYADAVAQGDGGDIVLWADQYAWIYGDIYARGGALSGDGGRIETSGYKYLDVHGAFIDASAFNGMGGEWLLDPFNVIIADAGEVGTAFDTSPGASPYTYTPLEASTILAGDISTALDFNGGTSVIVTTGDTASATEADITFTNDTAISWTSDANLTFIANRDIIFENADNDSSPVISKTLGGGELILHADANNTGADATAGSIKENFGTVTSINDIRVYYRSTNGFGTPEDFSGSISSSADFIAYMLTRTTGEFTSISGFLSQNFALADNLDFADASISSLGNYTGNFDGLGFTISDTNVNNVASGYTGLFAQLSGGTIRNIALDDVNIADGVDANDLSRGALVGIIQSGGSLEGTISVSNSQVLGTNISSTEATGGIVGRISNGSSLAAGTYTVDNIDVNGKNNVGGIVGLLEGSITGITTLTVNASTASTVDAAGGLGIGGIIGSVINTASIDATVDFSSAADVNTTVTTGSNIGGVFGSVTGVTIAGDATATGDVGNNTASRVGGILGLLNTDAQLTGTLTYGDGADTISGGQYLGGIVGQIRGTAASLQRVNLDDATLHSSVTFTSNGGTNIGGGIGSVDGDAGGAGIITIALTNGVADLSNFNPTVTLNDNGDNVGGIIGQFKDAVFFDTGDFDIITSATVVASGVNVGGVIGQFTGASSLYSTTDLSATGNVTGDSNVGGVIGGIELLSDDGTGTLELGRLAYATGTVKGDDPADTAYDDIGGIVGFLDGSNYAQVNVDLELLSNATIDGLSGDGTGSNIGGLVGTLEDVVFTSTSSIIHGGASNSVSGSTRVGGLIGYVLRSTINDNQLSNNYTVGDVNGASKVGGLFGELNNSTISISNPQSLQTTVGKVGADGVVNTDASSVGGIAGWLEDTTWNVADDVLVAVTATTSPITGSTSVGGIFGDVYYTGATGTLDSNFQFQGDIETLAVGQYLGGIFGRVRNTDITGQVLINAANTFTLAGLINDFGGFIGSLEASSSFSAVHNGSYTSDLNANGGSRVGGLIGNLQNADLTVNAIISTRLTMGVTSVGGSSIGGLVGNSISDDAMNPNEIAVSSGDPYGISADVTGLQNVGGLVGTSDDTTYAGSWIVGHGNDPAITITGNTDVGGVIGKVLGDGSDFTATTVFTTGQAFGSSLKLASNGTGGGIIGVYSAGAYNVAAGNTWTNNFNVSNTGGFSVTLGGIFGNLAPNITIENDLLNQGSVTNTSGAAAGIVSTLVSTATITSSISNTAAITGTTAPIGGIGGLFGTVQAGADLSLATVTANGDVSGGSNVGGYFGYVDTDVLLPTHTINTAPSNVSASAGGGNVGAIFGYLASDFTGDILGASSAGVPTHVSGGSFVGGIVGHLDGATLSGDLFFASSKSGEIEGLSATSDAGIGGIVGLMENGAELSGDITLGSAVQIHNTSGGTAGGYGGIVGILKDTSTISSSSIISNAATLTFFAGGLSNDDPIDNVGGIIGLAEDASNIGSLSSIANVNIGVSAANSVGGIIGKFGTQGGSNVINAGATLSNTHNVGNLDRDGALEATQNASNVGGIVGSTTQLTVPSTATLSNAGSVGGGTSVAGIFGDVTNSTLAGTYTMSAGAITGTDAGGSLAGGIIGNIGQDTALNGAFSTTGGTVSGTLGVGGLFGLVGFSSGLSLAPNATFSNAATVSGSEAVGGIAGLWVAPAILSNNFSNTGNIAASAPGSFGFGVGGLFGSLAGADMSGTLTNSGSVTDTIGTGSNIGGIAGNLGFAFGGSVPGSVSGTLSSTGGTITGGSDVGGLIGKVEQAGTSVTAQLITTDAVAVSGVDRVGGLVGNVTTDATFTPAQSVNAADVTGNNDVGGIVGLNTGGTISNALSSGTISGSGADIGGIVGENTGTVDVALSIVTIGGAGTNKGVLIGNNTGAGTLTNGIIDASLNIGIPGVGNGTGSFIEAPHSALTTQSTYVGFTFGANGWQLHTTATQLFYASPTWCGAACAVFWGNKPTPPTPPAPAPTPSFSNTDAVVEQQIRNMELDNNIALDPITIYNAPATSRTASFNLKTLEKIAPGEIVMLQRARNLPQVLLQDSQVIFTHPGYQTAEQAIVQQRDFNSSVSRLIDLLSQQGGEQENGNI
jgi:hypothetical protein